MLVCLCDFALGLINIFFLHNIELFTIYTIDLTLKSWSDDLVGRSLNPNSLFCQTKLMDHGSTVFV